MKNEQDYINNPYQLWGTRRYTLEQGFSKGVSCIDAKTSAGLSFTAVCDRALDISQFSYKGMNLTFLGRQGETAPSFYDNQGAAWLSSFFGGLVTTCGPMNIGKASKGYGLHDRFSNTPAVNICDESPYSDCILLKATIDFGILESPKIKCIREIRAEKDSAKITLTDRIINYGFKEEPLCILYHTNYGYPLLSEDTEVFIDSNEVEPYDEYSKSLMDRMMVMESPSPENGEKNYFHTMNMKVGKAHAFVLNKDLDIGVFIEWSDTLPIATHCRVENPGDYFLAIEPCNTLCMGRENIEKRDMLPIIKAGEEKEFKLSFEVLEGSSAKEKNKTLRAL